MLAPFLFLFKTLISYCYVGKIILITKILLLGLLVKEE